MDREGSAPPRIPPPPRPPRQQAKHSVEIWAITPQEIVRGSVLCLDGQRMSDALVAVHVNLIGGHSIDGRLYCQTGRRPLDVLNDEREFLPMVEVVAKLSAGVARRFNFVAINKTHIHRLEEPG